VSSLNSLSGNERFKAIDKLEVTEVPDGYVIYDEPNSKVHYLNPTAAVIFTVCDGSKTVSDIEALLRDAYDVEHVPDLAPFFDDLEKAGLVCRSA
jgi:hypothetical protein